MSWIDEEEELLQIQDDCDTEHMEEIECVFIFVNVNSYIEKISNEYVELNYDEENDRSFISKSKVLQMIQKQKTAINNSRYIYKESCCFNVDLQPEKIKDFSNENHLERYNNIFLKRLPLLEDIVIDPSIFIFHNLNCVYFLFEESNKTLPPPKPILKIHAANEPFKKSEPSKKVTIKINKKNKITRKKND